MLDRIQSFIPTLNLKPLKSKNSAAGLGVLPKDTLEFSPEAQKLSLEQLYKLNNDSNKDNYIDFCSSGENTFAWGWKPAILTGIKDAKTIPYYHRLADENTDVIITQTPRHGESQTYSTGILINKKLTKEIIENNKQFFILRLKMKKDASTDEIYDYLLSEKSPLRTDCANTQTSKYNDVLGLILGYPKISTMIFELECRSKIPNTLRSDVPKYKEKILKTLKSFKSPYRDMGKEFNQELAQNINSITEIKSAKDCKVPPGYEFIYYIPEPEELERIRSYISHAI